MLQDVKAIISMLIQNGADINGQQAGWTARDCLGHCLLENSRNKSLQNLFHFLIEQGADVNLPSLHGRRSILHTFMVWAHRDNQVSYFLAKLVTWYGAKLTAQEASDVFGIWCQNPKVRSCTRNYDFLRLHKYDIDAEALEDAWVWALETESKELYERLFSHCPCPSNAASLAAIALERPNHKLWSRVRELDFDANYVSPDGLSFLHLIVRKL